MYHCAQQYSMLKITLQVHKVTVEIMSTANDLSIIHLSTIDT